MSPLLYACVITGLGISNSRQGKEREVLLHKILRVAHSVAQITAKAAQNSPFRCSTCTVSVDLYQIGVLPSEFQDRSIQPLCHSSAVILLHLWNQRCTFFTCFFTFLARTKQTDDTLERRSQIDFSFVSIRSQAFESTGFGVDCAV